MTSSAPPIALDSPVESLRGVTPAAAKHLQSLGVHTAGDLLEYFPRTYQSEAAEGAIGDLSGSGVQIARGEVIAVDYIASQPRPRFEAPLEDTTGQLALVWFNGGYLRRIIHPGMRLRVKGKVRLHHNFPQMSQPKFEIVQEETERIAEAVLRPIYPATARLTSQRIAAIVDANLPELLEQVEEWFDEATLARRRIMGRREAYRAIHQPRHFTDAQRARRRLVYDELMLMQVGLGIGKRLRDGRLTAPLLRVDKVLNERILRRFPFEMTEGQRHATWEILKDLQSGRPMNRLLQGDVGSGKTAVAVYAMLVAVANRMQAVLLAPTEVLAEQHYLTLQTLLGDSAVKIELFTQRTRRQSRGAILKHLASGQTHLAVGTQALIQPDIEFANLGLVVVDEQHKLGVRQRAILKSKAASPHYLVMTATPIPRTLALSYFADFDLSTIDHLPPGRQPIITRWLRNGQAAEAHAFIREQVKAGHQAYIVVPHIEDDGLQESHSVKNEYEKLSKGDLSELRLGMLHGQMNTAEKQEVMTSFRDKRIDVLIATTVIEVGIDVPNATVMVIDNADRFGLSQLHQLRGRVGRGKDVSHCLLIADAANEATDKRLRAMTRTGNGFEIAEMDLQLRGPGAFFGDRQHGLPEFKLADLSSEMELLQQARDDAVAILGEDAKLAQPKNAALKRGLLTQFAENLALAQIG